MISASEQYKALVAKLEAINPSNVTETSAPARSELPVEECGGMMSMAPKQQDNVTMNVTAQGAGGIRDLMNLLHSMEQASNDEVVIGQPGGEIEIPVADEDIDGGFGDATTRPEEDTFGVDDVVKTGNDIHSKGREAPKVNGGGNPMQEELAERLAQHYLSIKEAKKGFDPLKHVKNPTKGEKDAAKDVKRGSYADRAAMLKSAEADGRLKEGEKKTMSRAAKGHEKYGKEGMQALAKAGKEGKDLDKVREKYNKYD